jgi:hypothetical protein
LKESKEKLFNPQVSVRPNLICFWAYRRYRLPCE